ncbi:MAG TPA: hypothetical protein DCL38_00450 [Lachnospiraceae bacterium]|nr:hypothetical protein [Lachnospiraceae bacterium]
MLLNTDCEKALKELLHKAVTGALTNKDYGPLCESVGVARMYYDMDLGDSTQYTDKDTGKYIMSEVEVDNKIILYDSGDETGLSLKYTYYYDGLEYVHAYIEFRKAITEEDINPPVYELLSDFIYMIVSRQNMRLMLDFSETNDALTGIPNGHYIYSAYKKAVAAWPSNNYAVMFINLQNYKFLNEQGGVKAGDEGMIRYAKKLASFVEEDEGLCRMGGDNFVLFIKHQNVNRMINILGGIEIKDLKSARDKEFVVSAWIGISMDEQGVDLPDRIDHANTACIMGKTRLKRNVVFYSDELSRIVDHSKRMIGLFYPALNNGEFVPWFQAKVDMRSGRIVGLEALCRWIHAGRYICPDEFIPIIDAQGMIHELDMEILRKSCAAVKNWKAMGLNPPPVSVNISRKNIFIPNIETKIHTIVRDHRIDPSDIEIEITETARESEYERLISFINTLKAYGFRIAIDDFGTGYSSLSLIHCINADVIKIDKSFISDLFTETRDSVLVESIISLAGRLKMETVAEGVETAEQGKRLLEMGCSIAQGYYYSRPADFEYTTDILKDDPYRPIA